MLTLEEIYTIREKVRGWLNNSEYQQVSDFLDTAKAEMKHDRARDYFNHYCSYSFLLDTRTLNTHEIVEKLLRWHQMQPEVSYPCLLLAQHWFAVAGEERGGEYARHLIYSQQQRALIANDLVFYWAAKAISLDADCVNLYCQLLVACGHFSEPVWFREAQPISLEHYSSDALAFIHKQGGLPPDTALIKTGLPPASQQEAAFRPLYWLNRVLALEPQNVYARSKVVQYLWPRWYGDRKHKAVDLFIAGDLCQNLSPKQRNVLLREKRYDQLEMRQPAAGRHKEVLKYDEQFRELLSLPLTPGDTLSTHLYYIDMCQEFLLDNGEFYPLSSHFAARIYDSLAFILNGKDSWVIYNHGAMIITWLTELLSYEEYKIADTQQLLVRYLQATQGCGESDSDIILAAFAEKFGFSGLSFFSTTQRFFQRVLAYDRSFSPDTLALVFSRLGWMGYGREAACLLHQLADAGAVNCAVLLGMAYSGTSPMTAYALSLSPSRTEVEKYLNVACQNPSPEALFFRSRLLEEIIGQTEDASQINALHQQRLDALVQARDGGHSLAQYDYACALFWSDDPKLQEQALKQECAQVLLDGKVSPEQRAYTGYLYGLAAFNGRGMKKNRWLARYWFNYANRWGSHPDWKKIVSLIGSHHTPRGPFAKKLTQRIYKLPAWQTVLIAQTGQLR